MGSIQYFSSKGSLFALFPAEKEGKPKENEHPRMVS